MKRDQRQRKRYPGGFVPFGFRVGEDGGLVPDDAERETTAALFTVVKSVIGWYLGSSSVASAYGAARALIIVLLWMYYSSEIFLLGSEFTRQYALARNPLTAVAETPKGRNLVVATPKNSGTAKSPVMHVIALVAVA